MAGYGMPQVDFSILGDLPETYRKAGAERSLSELGKRLSSGDIDYKQAAGLAADAGKLDVSLSLLKLGQEQEATKGFNNFITNMNGSGTAQPSAPPPSLAGIRAPVASSPQVWGDKEAEDAGLYEKPSVPPQQTAQAVPVAQPQPQSRPQAPSGVAPAMPQNPASGNITGLMRAVGSPGLPAGQRAVAIELLKKELDNSKMDPEQKNYAVYSAQERGSGREPLSFFEYQKDLKRAGATSINTAEGLDAAQAKARIAIDTHAIQDLSKKSASGRAALPLLDRMIQLSEKVPGGWAGPAAATFARAASALGIEVPEGASNAELLASMSRQFIPSVRDPGSTSNYEQQLYGQAVPGLLQSQEGRVKIASMFKSMVERNNEVVATYRKYVGSPELDKKLRELDAKPLFAEEDRKALEGAAGTEPPPVSGAPRRVNSPQERDALPPGTPYLAPDGNVRIRQQ